MARSSAREAAMQLIYERMMGGQGGEETMLGLMLLNPNEDDMAYIQGTVSGVFEHLHTLDDRISKYLVSWTMERLARVDLAILRLAVYEMLYREDIPGGVSINEAVELSRTFSTPESGGFINGVLGNFLRAEEKVE
ncbi:MAG: transcription antitermination factor NusB [Clostridia bacterium]